MEQTKFKSTYIPEESSDIKIGIKSNRFDAALRRIIDVTVAIMGLIVLFPVFLIIAFLIKRDSPGPIYFFGPRVGKDGKIFKILKFRTMYENPESYSGPKVTAQGDTRITPLGKWLRDTKINELPQLLNVLKGDMSLVGPRPEDPDIAATWSEDLKRDLFSVKPGVTSPASVLYRDEEAMLQSGNVMEDYIKSIAPDKHRLDRIYIRDRSILTDLDVVFWTLIILIPAAKKQAVPETKLYWGPFSIFLTNHFRWFMIDLFVAAFSISVIGVLWRTVSPLHIGWEWAPILAMAMAIVFGLSNSLMGLNRIYWSKARPSDTFELAISAAIAAGFLLLVNRLWLTSIFIPTGLFIFVGLLSFSGFVGVRYRERILTGIAAKWLQLRKGAKTIGERVLIIGAGDLGQFAAWMMRKGTGARTFSVLGMVDDNPRKQGMRIEGIKVLGTTKDIPDLIKQHNIGVVLFAISNITAVEKDKILNLCRQINANLVMIPNVIKIMRDNFQAEASSQPTLVIPDLFDQLGESFMEKWVREMDMHLKNDDLESARLLLLELQQRQGDLDRDVIENERVLER